MRYSVRLLARCLSACVVVAAPAIAFAAPITYSDIAKNPATGITYRRGKSSIDAIYDAIKTKPFMSFEELYASPFKPRGAPGVALLDYDRDGDLDIYVTNGPGRANSLYRSEFKQTGQLRFTDVAGSAGVTATDQDSTGTCFGDIDNDGDEDILVLGRMEHSRLFRNDANGTFTDISSTAHVGLTVRGHNSCTMGDINGDGLLDIFIANSFDWSSLQAIFNNLFGYSHQNELYVNQGGNVFADASSSSGVLALFNIPEGDGTITWAASMVDYDLDGDVDIFHADDHAAMPTSGFAGVDRGFMQIHKNDGTGHFTNVTDQSGSATISSSWMATGFADFNCDGLMDFFATSVGDYINPQFGIAKPPGFDSSRWHLALQDPPGVFTTPTIPGTLTIPNLIATPFGWGEGMIDYDNDGDTDVAYYGNMGAVAFVSADNPGIILRNDGCNAEFTWDEAATAADAEFSSRQTIEGVAMGDLNNDGFTDIVHASGQFIGSAIPLVPMSNQYGGPFDATARFLPTFIPIGPFEWEWSGKAAEEDGFLGIKVNSAGNGNKWVKINVKGGKGIATSGKNNRDGIGAVVMFTPEGGSQVMSPVLGGSSYASQHSLTQGFGLGAATKGTAEVLYGGGIRTRLYSVAAGETVTVPEIPCDFTSTTTTLAKFKMCVNKAVGEYKTAGIIDNALKQRLLDSAVKAWGENH